MQPPNDTLWNKIMKLFTKEMIKYNPPEEWEAFFNKGINSCTIPIKQVKIKEEEDEVLI